MYIDEIDISMWDLKDVDTTNINIFEYPDIDMEDYGGVYMNKDEIRDKAKELLTKLDLATDKGDGEEIKKVSKEIVNFLISLAELE